MNSKFHNFKYCPFCGNTPLVEESCKNVKCLNCNYVYFHNTASSVAAIIEIDRSILLTIRAYEPKAGMYDLPGGFVDYNESLENAIRRELFEELGINIEKASYLCSFPNEYIFKGVTYFTVDTFFVCNLEKNQKIVPSSEIIRYELVPIEIIKNINFAFRSNIKALEKYLQDRS